jgi:hypothetical protein
MRLTRIRRSLLLTGIAPLLLAGAVSLSALGAPGANAAPVAARTQSTAVPPSAPKLHPVLESSHETQTALVNGRRCYNAYVFLDWKNALGKTTFGTWLGIDWCAKRKRVISSHIYTRGGETSTPLWSFSGNHGKGTRYVGSQVRVYAEEEFSFGLGIYITHDYVCTQIRGNTTGRWSWLGSCNLS